MQGYVAVTEPEWWKRLSRESGPKDANFWRPSARRGRLALGTPFFFKLKAPFRKIAGFVWEHAVETARAEVEKEAASHWCWSAPRAELPLVADCLREPFPDWVMTWAYARAPDAGPAAGSLYGISMRGEE
ncbi:MAG: hypothetical protein RLP09_37320 [Sandaracinaceae bacterium]